MAYAECVALVVFLNRRFAKAKMNPWYLWGIEITWDKLRKWGEMLNYRGEASP